MNLAEPSKVCTKCQADKPLSEFYANGGGRSGRHSECKACFVIGSVT